MNNIMTVGLTDEGYSLTIATAEGDYETTEVSVLFIKEEDIELVADEIVNIHFANNINEAMFDSRIYGTSLMTYLEARYYKKGYKFFYKKGVNYMTELEKCQTCNKVV